MSQRAEIWHFVASRLANRTAVMLLVVAESRGSSPGRAGYKMGVTASGEMVGSIGGGVMEVKLVEQAKATLSKEPGCLPPGFPKSRLIDQVHQPLSPNASGMICSGRQTVIAQRLTPDDRATINAIIENLENRASATLMITQLGLGVRPGEDKRPDIPIIFQRSADDAFTYEEVIAPRDRLIIIGGGHCSLALSELMSKLQFQITVFDDRPEINTVAKNRFADRIEIIGSYENIGSRIEDVAGAYVVVMTLGYISDESVVRQLISRDFKYFGVLGSRAKMKTLLRQLATEGCDTDLLDRIRTPIGLKINSRTPEEIAVSIAAEIIAVKNGAAC